MPERAASYPSVASGILPERAASRRGVGLRYVFGQDARGYRRRGGSPGNLLGQDTWSYGWEKPLRVRAGCPELRDGGADPAALRSSHHKIELGSLGSRLIILQIHRQRWHENTVALIRRLALKIELGG